MSLLNKVKAQQSARQVRRILSDKFEAQAHYVNAVVVGANLVAVGGQQYPATGISGSQGETVSVRNIGSAAAALYAPAGGSAAAVRAGASGEGDSVLDHEPVTLAAPSGLLFADELNQAGLALADTVAGDGLIISGKVLAVGAGTLITVGADSVGIAPGAAHQFIGTGSGTAAGWRNVAELAGAGLAANAGVLAVGAGAGITVNADDVAVRLKAVSGLEVDGSGLALADSIAGAGLAIGGKVLAVGAGHGIAVGTDSVAVQPKTISGLQLDGSGLAVGAGTLIAVGADTVGIAPGAAYQFIGTGSGTAAGWRNVAELAGAGLAANAGVLAVGAGAGITVNADDVAVRLKAVSGLEVDGSGLALADSIAGAGLAIGGKVLAVGAGHGIAVGTDSVAVQPKTISGLQLDGSGLAVGAGTLIAVGADTVGIAPGAAYQFIGTGSGTAAGWRNVAELAGAGLAANAGVLAVGAGAGITVNADDVALTTPGSLSVSSANAAAGNHTHAVISSSDPGAAASLLASDNAGQLTLPLFVATTKVRTALIDSAPGTSLTLRPAQEVILDPDGAIVRTGEGVAVQGWNYASQTTGWRITDAGEADFRYLFVDEMHAKTFVADLEQALAGGQIIAKSVAVVAETFRLPTGSGPAQTLGEPLGALAAITQAEGNRVRVRFRDLPSAPGMAVFENNDWVAFRQFSRAGGSLTIGWAWGRVTARADNGDGTQTWTWTRDAATPGAAAGWIYADALALDFGVSGNGYYEVNAIDGAYGANSPYAQIVTWSEHPATQTVNARYGRLRGIFNDAGEYGLYAGDGVTPTSRYIRASNQAVELHNVPLKLYDGSTNTLLVSAGAGNNAPAIAMGATLPTGPLVGNGLWMGKDGSDYEFRVGTVSGGALVQGLHWDGTTLTIAGNGAGVTSISGNNITTGTINASAVTVSNINASNITTGTLSADRIGANSITAGKLNVASLSAITANMGALTVDGVLSVGASGGIYQGTGTFASPTTGLKIWNDGGVGRIAAYNSGVIQWGVNTDGRMVAGQGDVVIDSGGIKLATGASDGAGARSLNFWSSAAEAQNGTGQVLSYISATTASDNHNLYLRSIGTGLMGDTASVKIQAATGAGGNAVIFLQDEITSSSIEIQADTIQLDGEVATGGIRIGGDIGGEPSTLTLTNATGAAGGAGTGTVKMNDGSNRNNNGFIKMYVGNTSVFVPYWTTIAG